MTEDDAPRCIDCTGKDIPYKDAPWRNWRCNRVPKPARVQFVVWERWSAEDPHPRCDDVNAYGQCRFFEQERKDDGECK